MAGNCTPSSHGQGIAHLVLAGGGGGVTLGYPPSTPWMRYPNPDLGWGTPHSGPRMGYPLSRPMMGYPLGKKDGVTPIIWMGVTGVPPSRPGMGYPSQFPFSEIKCQKMCMSLSKQTKIKLNGNKLTGLIKCKKEIFSLINDENICLSFPFTWAQELAISKF